MAVRRPPFLAASTGVALVAAGATTAACGDGQLPLGRGPIPLTEHDPAGDVSVVLADTPPRGQIAPELDLRAAGAVAARGSFRLRVVTQAPPRSATLTFTAATDEPCFDAQLTVEVRIDAAGRAAVRASDVPEAPLRRVAGTTASVAGEEVTVAFPIEADAHFRSWYVSSTDAREASGDTVPDWYIEGATFTRGTGTPNSLNCGPADPPLLRR